MPAKPIVVVLLIAPTVLLATPAKKVEVVADVPLVAQVDSPATVELLPGETRLVTLRIACNQPWLVAVQTDNPQIRATGQHAGNAGGMAARGHTFLVTLTCSPDAVGPQRTTLATRLVSGPLAAGLTH
jgi:hypothetical protein